MVIAKAILLTTVIAVILAVADSNSAISNATEPSLGALETRASVSARVTGDNSTLALSVARSLRTLSGFLASNAGIVRRAIDDVLFCIRLSRGQLEQLRAETPEVYEAGELGQLLTEAEEDLNTATEALEANFHLSPNFEAHFSFSRIPALAETIPRLNSTFSIPDFEAIWVIAYLINLIEAGSVSKFGPQTSDRCMGQLQPEDLPCAAPATTCRPIYCPVDVSCWLMTTKPRAQGYYLTHQLLFLLLGENGGCAPDFRAHVLRYFGGLLPADAGVVTSEIMRHQCWGILRDARLIASHGYPDEVKDLFLEQGFLCGAAFNMPEFFTPEWIRLAISWQKPPGCFGYPSPSNLSNRTADYAAENDDVEIAENDGEIPNVDGQSLVPEPRVEESLPKQCYAHFSAVALGYFAVAMRYLTEQ